MRNRTSCLESAKLTARLRRERGGDEREPAKAASGQKKRGTSMRSRRVTTSASQQTIATASSDWATAIEN